MSIEARGRAVPIPEVTKKTPLSEIRERQAFDPETGLPTELRKKLDAWNPRLEGGEPVMAGLDRVEGGKEIRKDPPEDVKLKDAENRLFGVFDGVSTAESSALAAKLAAFTMHERLGADLERELANLANNGRLAVEDRKDMMDDLVKARMRVAVRDAHERCVRFPPIEKKHPDGSTETVPTGVTTASVAKLVEMPDGEKHVYFANVGDSRVYLQDENGNLEALTTDDGILARAVRQGQVTPEQAMRIDQAKRKEDLDPEGQALFAQRNVVTESVGTPYSRKPDAVVVRMRTVRPGQRLVITSDGIHDNLLMNDMRKVLAEAEDDRRAEKALQLTADELSKLSRKEYGRGKKDDMSAVVYEIPERLPVRREGSEEEKTQIVPGITAKAEDPTLIATKEELLEQVRQARMKAQLRAR
jgi:serine/threonine protein phosphatase PrpC